MFLVSFEGFLICCFAWYETGRFVAFAYAFVAFTAGVAIISLFESVSAFVALAMGAAYAWAAHGIAASVGASQQTVEWSAAIAFFIAAGAHFGAFRCAPFD